MNLFGRLMSAMMGIGPDPEPGAGYGAESGVGMYRVAGVNAGVQVDHGNALAYSAVFACVRVISDAIASVPWQVRARKAGGGSAQLYSHPLYPLLHDAPNSEMSAVDFRSMIVASLLLWGNAYAGIERNRRGQVIALWPIRPDRVQVHRRPARNGKPGAIFYRFTDTGGEVDAPDMLHFRGMSYDGLVGLSIVTLARLSLSLGMSAEKFGAAFFANGTALNTIIKVAGKLGDEGQKRLREQIEERHQGPAKAHRPLVLEQGTEIENLGMPMKDAQFLDTRQFQTLEVARWFGVPPNKIAEFGRATFNNVEHMNMAFVRDTLLPWTTRLESEVYRKLLMSEEERTRYSKINLNGLLRGDTKARLEWYTGLSRIGAMNVNEIRELEDMNPIEGGDLYFVEMNKQTLQQAAEHARNAEAGVEQDAGDDGDGGADATRGRRGGAANIFEAVLRSLARKEQRAVEAAEKRYDSSDEFAAALAEFYETHIEHLVAGIAPLTDGVAGVMGVPGVGEMAVRVVFEQAVAERRNCLVAAFLTDDAEATTASIIETGIHHDAETLATLVATSGVLAVGRQPLEQVA